jgi:lipopolysaccharide/colanic/teichoic acid biosynthesis glycosyltransferase
MYLRFGKRILDLIGSTIGLVGCLPLFGILGVFIKASSSGPVFFQQERMGKDGRVFRLFKFRTMVQDQKPSFKQFTPGDESRVTGIGRILRRTKWDELPQLINVLAGDMSLIGPRPEVPEYRPFYGGEFRRVLDVKPGMTDFASVKYREEEKLLTQSIDPEGTYTHEILPDKLRLNLKYVEGIRFSSDLKILRETFNRMIFPRKKSSSAIVDNHLSG